MVRPQGKDENENWTNQFFYQLTFDSTDTQKTESSKNVDKPLVSCEMCGHPTKTNNGMKLHMKRTMILLRWMETRAIKNLKKYLNQMNALIQKLHCIDSETGYSELTEKLAWYRKRKYAHIVLTVVHEVL